MTRRATRRATAAALTAALLLGPAATARPAVAAPAPARCTSGGPAAPETVPWAQRRLGLDLLADGFRGTGVTIAVVGSGVDASHPQLAGRVVAGQGVGTTADPLRDCLGYGTAVAGAAAAVPVRGSALRGVAPGARIVSVRLPDWLAHPDGPVRGDDVDRADTLLAEAVRSALDQRARVVVLPPVPLPAGPSLRTALATARDRDALVVEPAPKRSGDDAGYPFADPSVLGVVAHAVDGSPAGTDADPRAVDLAAPGVDVDVLSPGGGWSRVGDASVAAGFVAGAAALVLEADGAVAPQTLRRRLVLTAVSDRDVAPVPQLDPAGALGPLPRDGTGRSADAGTPVPVTPPRLSERPPVATPTQSSVGIATGALVVLALLGIGAAAALRGAQRGWAPAGPVDPAHVISPPPTRSI